MPERLNALVQDLAVRASECGLKADRLSIALALVFGLGACGEDGPPQDSPDPSFYGEDSDVPIHLLRGEENAPEVVVERSRVVIGDTGEGEGSGIPLYLVEDAARLDDGTVVVANRSSSQLIVVDSSGQGLRTIGGPGSGPGEFRRLVSLLRTAGDTLITFDGESRRLSWFTSDGTAIRQHRVEPPSQASPGGLAGAVGALPDGRALVWSQVRLTPERIVQLNTPHTADQIERILFTVEANGAAASVVGVFPGPVMYAGPFVAPTGETTVANWGEAPFADWTGFGLHEDRVYVFRGAERGFEIRAAEGNLLQVVRGDWPVRRVSRDDRLRHIEEWVDRFPGWATPADRRAAFQEVRYPEFMPGFRDAVLGTDGIAWLEPYHLWDGENRHYIGYDPDGVAVGRLTLGYHERILSIGDGSMLLREIRELGVETVRMAQYRF